MSAPFDLRLGQLFVLEWPAARWSRALDNLLRTFQPAGVLVTARNARRPALLTNLAARASTVLRTTSLVGSLGGDTGALEPALPASTGRDAWPHQARKSTQAAAALGKMRAMILRGTGRNVDFSLSLDLTSPARKAAQGRRTSRCDPRLVARCAAAYVRGLRSKQVMACGKHFPGLGSVEVNPQTKALVSAKPMAALWREDLVPFRELLPRLPLVMLSLAAYKAYDFDVVRPAALSSEVVRGLLRVKLGYQGVAVANLAELGRVVRHPDVNAATVQALQAGCDLLIVRGNRTSTEGAVQAVDGALNSGKIAIERIEESLARIRAMKKRLAKPAPAASGRTFRRQSREIRECLRQLRENE